MIVADLSQLAAILFPSDAHAPGLAAGASEPVIKIVIKVMLE